MGGQDSTGEIDGDGFQFLYKSLCGFSGLPDGRAVASDGVVLTYTPVVAVFQRVLFVCFHPRT